MKHNYIPSSMFDKIYLKKYLKICFKGMFIIIFNGCKSK